MGNIPVFGFVAAAVLTGIDADVGPDPGSDKDRRDEHPPANMAGAFTLALRWPLDPNGLPRGWC